MKGDPINKIGYKNGLMIGLVIAGLGSLLFYPAAETKQYGFFLLALFTLGAGVTLIQIAANPYVALLGDEHSAPARLNLSQGLNSLGTVLAPIVGGLLLFGTTVFTTGDASSSLKWTYAGLGCSFLLLAAIVKLVKLPDFKNEEDLSDRESLLNYPHFIWGVFAIFFYVGSEVAVGSILIQYLGLESVSGMDVGEADKYLSFYWGGLMIGRFAGALAFTHMALSKKLPAMIGVAMSAFLIIYGAVSFKHFTTHGAIIDPLTVAPYLLLIALAFVLFFVAKGHPGKTIGCFSLMATLLTIISIFAEGQIAMWSMIGIGLFCSIMWSNIFTLSIQGLGKAKSRGSSLLVMMVVGGAILPAIQGALTDSIGLRPSLFIVVVGFTYLAIFGFIGSQATKKNLGSKKSELVYN
jgi:FHS family L-fucose permease-like MFS transporter